jgi:small-conductance mechanosensitive channel
MADLIHLLVEFAAVTGLDRVWQRRGEELAFTCLVLLVAVALQRLARRRAQGFDDRDLGRAFAVRARNAVVAGVVLILLLAWGSDLKSLAVSVAALGAAAVLAMREVIVCALGGVYRVLTSAYEVGDIIEVTVGSELVGEVVDIDLMHTELIERTRAGHATTTRLRFPNSVLLTTAVRKQGGPGELGVRTLRIPVKPDAMDLARAEAALMSAAAHVCEPFADEAELQLARRREDELVGLPSHRLRVALVAEKPDEVALVLRYPCPAGQHVALEREILLGYFRSLHHEAEPVNALTRPPATSNTY